MNPTPDIDRDDDWLERLLVDDGHDRARRTSTTPASPRA
jgi:hypothetical protein